MVRFVSFMHQFIILRSIPMVAVQKRHAHLMNKACRHSEVDATHTQFQRRKWDGHIPMVRHCSSGANEERSFAVQHCSYPDGSCQSKTM
jgi:hypothetical protein